MKFEPSFPTVTPDRPESWRLSREIEALKVRLEIAEHSPGRLAFIHRAKAMSYVRQHDHKLFREAMSYGYEQVSKDGVTYDDVVSRLEARVAEADALIADFRRAIAIAEFPDECGLCGLVEHEHAHDCPVPRLVAWHAQEPTL